MDDQKIDDLITFVPNLRLWIWTGPYRGHTPPGCHTLEEGKETEVSVQALNEKGKPWGPVHRFPRNAPLETLFKALGDYQT